MSSRISSYVSQIVDLGIKSIRAFDKRCGVQRFHVFAAIVKNGKIVSVARNYQCFHHAEGSLIKRFRQKKVAYQ